MAVVNPLPKERAAPEVHETYEGMTKQFGKMPNIFATMAHRPKHQATGALHLHAGHRVVHHPVVVVDASTPNLRWIGFKRVDVYHPAGKMWLEVPTCR
jgi:hypothetical protein